MGRLLATVASFVVVTAGLAFATPAPGTANQVAAQVAASSKITTVDATVAGELASSGSDWWKTLYPGTSQCLKVTDCMLGDVSSNKTLVLFGDSHAAMWLPAIVPVAKAAKFRVILLYTVACPLAALRTYYYDGSPPNPNCGAFHNAAIAAIRKLHPRVLLLGERTSAIYRKPGGALFSNVQWATALVSTIRQLRVRGTKIGLIEDVPYLDLAPNVCLALHPTDVQKCSVPNPNPKYPAHVIAEIVAAKETGIAYVRTVQWLCTKSCSPVVGNFVTYVDHGHVTANYSAYLSGVMGAAIKPLL